MKKIIVVLTLLSCTNVFANSQIPSLWQDVETSAQTQFRELSSKGALKKRSMLLDVDSLKARLASNNTSVSARASDRSSKPSTISIEIELPLANDNFVRVKAYDSPILSPAMAEAHPEIKTWRVVGVDDPSITGRIDFTQNGFHGMLTLADGDTVYIDPENKHGGNLYKVLSKRDNKSHFHSEFNCQVHDHHVVHIDDYTAKSSSKVLSGLPALDLKTYRLAVAGTGEYTTSQGGTKALAYASMVTTVNRVNEIYQRDIGIKLELVSGENLIYTNSATDPYTNNDTSDLVAENIVNMDTNFGVANFDIGHVFAQGNIGGLAYVGVACINQAMISATETVNAVKAGGATGTTNPSGETFSIEYVAHEIGHQLGASHTFNTTQAGCGGSNREATTAVEPGSGSTIMSYAGLCGTDNLQFNSEAMFHYASIDQINDYTRNGSGNACGTDSSTGNQNPEANAGADINIPTNTPFLLDGSATGGTTYTWDQMDAGTASAVDIDLGDNAIVRTLLPSSEEDRYIPRLSDLFAGTSTLGEKLPQTSRSLTFTYVVRDGLGGIGTDEKVISATNTGTTFSVKSQASAETLLTGQSIQVEWDKASTDVAPISCANVDVQLLRVNGVKNMLLASTPNDGSQLVTIPNATPAMTGARIMVGCSDNSFFNISSGEIALQVSIDTTPPVITVLGNNPLSIPQGSVYTDAGATAVDDFDGAVTVSTSGTVNTAVGGTYTITYSATDIAGNTATTTRSVTVAVDSTPPVISVLGTNPVSVPQGASYTDAGATAVDDFDGAVTVSTSGTVNTAISGTYTITYSATDVAGNTATTTRSVTVLPDTTPPVISILGTNPISVPQGTAYTDAGATADDAVDGAVVVSSSGSVDTNVLGDYTITYTATDNSSNTAVTTRTVTVFLDEIAPVITLSGGETLTLTVGETFTDPGFSAIDNHDGIVSVTVTGVSAVNTSVAGEYKITYTATDISGNTITEERIIIVEAAAPGTTNITSSGGGSFGYLIMPFLMLLVMRRRKLKH